MALSSPEIGILFEHSEWFQPLFAELDRRGIPASWARAYSGLMESPRRTLPPCNTEA
jgi:hypothetical protein